MDTSRRHGFSEKGEFFVYYSEDGKFRVWDTATGKLKQEYTPNFHLSSPCVSLKWFKLARGGVKNTNVKRPKGDDGEEYVVALGMLSGQILVYSLSYNEVVTILKEGPSNPVNSLSWIEGSNLYCSAGEIILEWIVSERKIKRSWKGGNHIITSLLVLPDGKGLLSAAKNITLWSLPGTQRIRTYTGHASDVCSLVYVPPPPSTSNAYFISTGKADRFLSVWSLDTDKQLSVGQFVMEDIAMDVSAHVNKIPTVSAVTGSGVIHLYHFPDIMKSSKPVKPKTTVRIASKSCQGKESVSAIPIIGGKLLTKKTIITAYGNVPWIKFEKLAPETGIKAHCLVREDPRKIIGQGKAPVSKVMQPVIGNDVQYLNQALEVNVSGSKRGRKDHTEVPMEDRVNNLTLSQSEISGKVPRADSSAHLLVQALVSKDKKMLMSALSERDETVIRRTVSRLPIQVVLLLVGELATLMHGKEARCKIAARWLRIVIIVHSSHILANPEVANCLGPIMGIIDTRLNMLIPLLNLRGRLDLLMDQLATAQTGNMESQSLEGLTVYQDSYSSEEESVEESDVDENWDEFSDVAEEDLVKDMDDQDESDQGNSDQDNMSVE